MSGNLSVKSIHLVCQSELIYLQYGSDCLFAHGPADLKAFTVPESEQLYKTVPCKNWEAEGKCQWGEQCKWAHGKEDLQAGGQPQENAHSGGQAHAQPHSSWNSQRKTVLCTKWSDYYL